MTTTATTLTAVLADLESVYNPSPAVCRAIDALRSIADERPVDAMSDSGATIQRAIERLAKMPTQLRNRDVALGINPQLDTMPAEIESAIADLRSLADIAPCSAPASSSSAYERYRASREPIRGGGLTALSVQEIERAAFDGGMRAGREEVEQAGAAGEGR
jgi:hypothetical protein